MTPSTPKSNSATIDNDVAAAVISSGRGGDAVDHAVGVIVDLRDSDAENPRPIRCGQTTFRTRGGYRRFGLIDRVGENNVPTLQLALLLLNGNVDESIAANQENNELVLGIH